MDLDKILAFIKKNNLAVISTVSEDGTPQSAVVEFGELDDLTIIVDMLMSSRKYKNLQQNPKVALVIGWDDNITVQIQADAQKLTGEELERAQKSYFAKNPRAEKWATKPDIAFYAFKPYWLRYSDLNQDPWFVKEFNL